MADRLIGMIVRFMLVMSLVTSLSAHASDAAIRYAEIVTEGSEYVINADVSLKLSEAVIDAIDQAVPINFVAEASIESPRWYWFDATLASERLEFSLSYHPMTRSYRLAIGSLHQDFETLDSALETMTRIRRWAITPMKTLVPGESYNVQLRFRLETELLPRPFQVSTIGSRDWEIESDWLRWTFLASPIPVQ
ncbi:DUF4390 domain-containing protein [Nitrogeniibacter aestuarii]|uniref:DUF4390 domain-containing protein n=1 Tax=Nitrogeniibacter aestuarii TaxID=2815343 RepID=UPI001E46122D|nr:DUF4390 domain-containing protein [Nitrogeniibacter aestuarii]